MRRPSSSSWPFCVPVCWRCPRKTGQLRSSSIASDKGRANSQVTHTTGASHVGLNSAAVEAIWLFCPHAKHLQAFEVKVDLTSKVVLRHCPSVPNIAVVALRFGFHACTPSSLRFLDHHRHTQYICSCKPFLPCHAGQGRACLVRWVAAARVVQSAFRVWHFRHRLIRGRQVRQTLQAATIQLQAMWRARQPFRSYQALRHAAIRTQVHMACLLHAAVLYKTIVVQHTQTIAIKQTTGCGMSTHQRLVTLMSLLKALDSCKVSATASLLVLLFFRQHPPVYNA